MKIALFFIGFSLFSADQFFTIRRLLNYSFSSSKGYMFFERKQKNTFAKPL